MICEICNKNEGNIVFQVYNNGKMITRTICSECAVAAQNQFFKALRIVSNSVNQKSKQTRSVARLPESICTSCGTAISEITEDTLLGCPNCYDVARVQLAKLKQKDKAENTEEGEIAQPKDILAQMHHELRSAIVMQDFELAASIRDKIRKTEETLSVEGDGNE